MDMYSKYKSCTLHCCILTLKSQLCPIQAIYMRLSIVGHHGKILTTASSQVLPPPTIHYSPLGEHKVLGIGELWGTGMLLYLAWPGLRTPADCPAPLHTLTCGHSGMQTHTLSHTRACMHTHVHKASVAAETWWSNVGNPSQQSAVFTN